MNLERLMRIIEDMQECLFDMDECLEILETRKDDEMMIKLSKSSLRQLFVSFHTILEDLVSIILKEEKKYKIGISLHDGIEILYKSGIIIEDDYKFLDKSRLMRNRISHRYKDPSHEELLEHTIKYRDNFDNILKLAKSYMVI